MIFKTSGVCSKEIEIEVEGKRIKKVRFKKGCDGNLKAISILVEGMEIGDVISKFKGLKCGTRSTSCPDQLATALEMLK